MRAVLDTKLVDLEDLELEEPGGAIESLPAELQWVHMTLPRCEAESCKHEQIFNEGLSPETEAGTVRY